MLVRERLTQAMKEAMKAQDKATLSTVRLILAQIQRKEQDMKDDAIKKGKPVPAMSESDVIDVIGTFIKQTREEAEEFAKRSDTDKVQKLDNDIAVATSFLPKQLTKEEITRVVHVEAAKIEMVGQILNKGNLMKVVMSILKGQADNKIIGEVVDEVLKG